MDNKETPNTNKPPSGDKTPKAALNPMASNIELDSITQPQSAKSTDKEDIKHKEKDTKPRRGLSAKSAMLHTYKEDVQSLVKNRKISMVRAMAMQSDKKTLKDGDELITISSKEAEPKGGVSRMFLIISSILMLILGMSAIYIAYSAYQRQLVTQNATNKPMVADKSMIFTDYRINVDIADLSNRKVLSILNDAMLESNTTLGSVTQFAIKDTGRLLTQQELPIRFGLSLDDQFIRLMGRADRYMVGFHVADRNTPFILLTTTSSEHALATLLDWEKVGERELRPFFNSPGSRSLSRTPSNIKVENLNARVMRDDEGNIRFLYSFLDDNTILITNNINTLREVSQRYKIRKAALQQL